MLATLPFILAVEEMPAEHRHWMWHIMERYGLWAVVTMLFSCGLGVPVPEDIPLLFVGFMIARGSMILPVAAAAWVAILAGDCVLYSLSYWLGQNVTTLPVIGSHLNKDRLKSVEGWFDKYGVWAVGVGRMFAGVRGAMVVVAGITRFNFAKFIVADGIAAIFSGGAFIFIGYISYRLGSRSTEHLRTLFVFICVAVALIIAGYFIVRQHRRSKISTPSNENEPPAI